MGPGRRKPILPAPTESLVDSVVEDTAASTDLATDISHRTDRTSATIPDDGSPVTISTGQKIKAIGSHAKGGNHSQTSLLIEYYEGQKEPGSTRRPSLRVRVRPSTSKSTEKGEGYLAVTREQGSRKPSYTQRIPLGSRSLNEGSSEFLTGVPRPSSAATDIEIEGQQSDMSDISASPEARYIIAPSDISSMPPESILGTSSAPIRVAPVATSSGLSNSELGEGSELQPPVFPRERNLSHERITQKAIEKLSSKERESPRSVRSNEKSRSRSGSATYEIRNMPAQERRRKSAKIYPEESSISGGTGSVVSNSVLSAGAKSLDEKSVRSGNSNITNPRLLQTVEDAIRRLILPELKEIKRNGSQRTRRKEEYYSDISDDSIVREKAAASRRVPSGSRTKRRPSKGSGSGSRRRHQHDVDVEYESPSEASSHQRDSGSGASAEHRHRAKSGERGLRDRDVAASAAAGAALTAAALHHQDSASTLERRERRKRSKSQSSRSASVAETEDTFEKNSVPPMPFRSEIGSELTRSSLLSSNTADTTTPTQKEVREVIRGSAFDGASPLLSPPAHGSGDLRQSLGTHHRNFSGPDLNVQRNSLDESRSAGEFSPEMIQENFAANELLDPERLRAYERNLHQQHPIRRGLSPIQSVASYATTEPNRHSTMQTRSIDSMSSLKRRQQLKEEPSVDSFLSASPSVQKQIRPQGVNLENRSEIMHQHDDAFYDQQHNENDKYRQSFASDGPKTDVRHLTNYTDDSMDAPHEDKISSGQYVAEGYGANPEYVYTPPGVESAVASLIEPSLLDVHEPPSPQLSAADLADHDHMSVHTASRDLVVPKGPSPYKDRTPVQSNASLGKSRAYEPSPPQSPASIHSYEEDLPDDINVTSGEQKPATSPESEITTNPSVIQGPIGGLSAGNRDHWPYGPTPDREAPKSSAQQVLTRDPRVHASDLMPEALNLSQRQNFDAKSDLYTSGEITPPGKDEGYATGDKSPGLYTKQNERIGAFTPDDLDLQDDPFVVKRNKYMSGMSQGMSPLYDSATGRGIDRIQSKDIVALMDHLTVRDAQRNARDTEILVTLVRSAAEMRNSFEDMKKFIAEQDEYIINAAERQHEKTQRVIGGPRPLPTSSRATPRDSAVQEDDMPAKRRNIFKRALQGLGSKNAAELQNIETMLMQLLNDVGDLKATQGSGRQSMMPAADEARAASLGSVENTRAPTDTGYEPEGQAGTSSTGDHSGIISNQSSRHEYRVAGGQRESMNRVSTVIEGDEEEDEIEDEDDGYDMMHDNGMNRNTALGSHQTGGGYQHQRGQSVPVSTPPKMHDQVNAPWSNEDTPRSAEPTSTRKGKGITSAFFPKLMSRWSKTTTSTEPRFSTQNKARPYSQVSRSGSDLAEYAHDPQPGDRLRSNTSLQDDHDEYRDQENRPPSPLVPSQVSENPKYQGYRNSKDLEHPQPRQGPTGRYQTRLENEAQNYHDQSSPALQYTSQWDGQAAARETQRMNQEPYQPQPPLSPISDDGYSEVSDGRSLASSRRQRLMDDEPLVPQRPPKIPMSPSTYVDHVTAARAGSPAYDKSPVSALRSPQGSGRKPSGPRPYGGVGQPAQTFKGDFNTVKKTRFRGSPYHISSSEDVSYGVGA